MRVIQINMNCGLTSLPKVLKYIELELNKMFAPQSLRIKFEPSQGSMTIDLSTIVSLELIQNLQSAKSKDSLFGLLNATLTPMGSRLLRANILQPSTDVSKLMARYDAVEDLSSKEEMFTSTRQGLFGGIFFFFFALSQYPRLTIKLLAYSIERFYRRGKGVDICMLP